MLLPGATVSKREKKRLIVKPYNKVSATAYSAYKTLRTQVIQRMRDHKLQSLMVTSPTAGNGKTVTAINLAMNLVRQAEGLVLLVDLDLRRPRVGSYLGLTPPHGVVDVLTGQVSLADISYRVSIPRLIVLPCNSPVEDSSELLSSDRMRLFMQELKQTHAGQPVIIDMPPVLDCDDVLAFSPHADASLLVVESGKTKGHQVGQALQMLSRTAFLGVVMNKSRASGASYYYACGG